MGLSVVTGPTFDPLTLAEVKDHLRVDESEEDGLIAGYILAARRFAEGDTRRVFATQTLDYTLDWNWSVVSLDGWCSQQIDLPVSPVQSVTSVKYIDAGGSLQTLSPTQYVTRIDTTIATVTPIYGVTWPATLWVPAAVTVRFVAGWDFKDFPDDLRVAMLMLVAHWYEHRETVNVGNIVNELPFATEALLSGYRVLRVL